MTRFHRDPVSADGLDEAPRDSPFPQVPYHWICLFDPVGKRLSSALRTQVRPAGQASGAELNPAFYISAAAAVLEQIEAASLEAASLGSNRQTCLTIAKEANRLTGRTAVIVRRRLAGNRYSIPLAELPTRSGKLDDEACRRCHALGLAASSRQLSILVHAEHSSGMAERTTFAIRGPEETGGFEYYARLLLTSYEVSQWSNPGLELGGTSVS